MGSGNEHGADQYMVARWSVGGLRAYLWLEGGLLSAVVAALGAQVVSVGIAALLEKRKKERPSTLPFPFEQRLQSHR